MNKKNKLLMAIIIVLFIIILLLCGYIIYDKISNKNSIKTEEQSEGSKEQVEEKEDKAEEIAFSIVKDNDIYVVKTTGVVEKISSNYAGNAAWQYTDFDNNKLYYVATDKTVHSIDLKTNQDNGHNIKINSMVFAISISGNNVITQYFTSNGPQADIYNLETGEKTSTEIKSNNNNHVYENIFFYTNSGVATYYYDLKTGKTEEIAKESRIITAEGPRIVYQDNIGQYLYDYTSNTKTLIKSNQDNVYSGENTTINNDVVYFIGGDINGNYKLYKSKDGTNTQLQDLNINKYFMVEYEMFKLNDNTLLIKESGNKKEDCHTSDVLNCNTPTIKYYTYNIEKNSLEESKTDYSILNYSTTNLIYNN